MICRPPPYLVDSPKLVPEATAKTWRAGGFSQDALQHRDQGRIAAYPGHYDETITDIYIPTLVRKAPTDKSQKDEKGAKEHSDRGAYKHSGSSIIARMLQEILVLLGSGIVALVGHDDGTQARL